MHCGYTRTGLVRTVVIRGLGLYALWLYETGIVLWLCKDWDCTHCGYAISGSREDWCFTRTEVI